jgi:hypothetical protein
MILKLTPFQVLLRTLTKARGGMTAMTHDEVHARLKRLTGQDFGLDVEAWRAWGESHPEITGMTPEGERADD